MNLDLELFCLITRYGIFQPDPVLQEIYMYEYYGYYANEILRNIPENKIIAIRGNGLHTEELFKLLDEQQKDRILYLIDHHEGDIPEHRNISILHPEQVRDTHIDVVLLSTFKWRHEFMIQLMDFMPKLEVIDIYDEMERQGIFFAQEFYTYPGRWKKHVNYTHTAVAYKKYRSATTNEQKRFNLERLIAYLVEIRDFLTTEKMIQEYIKNGWDVDGRYHGFWHDLTLLFDKISQNIKERHTPDIIINYIDNINADEFYETEFGKKRLSDSYCFMNAYTPTPWTYLTTAILLDGKLPITDRTYKKRMYADTNTKLLSVLKSHGYAFSYIAYHGMYQRYFENPSEIPKTPKGFGETSLPGETAGNRARNECSTRMQWYSLRECLKEINRRQSVCHWIHNLAETHAPFVFSLKDNLLCDPYDLTERAAGKAFILEQIDWYARFYTDESNLIYLSDHGHGLEFRGYERAKVHIPLVVKGPKFPATSEKRLYTHQKFWYLIKAIISSDENEWNQIFSEYIIHENIDYMHLPTGREFLLDCIMNNSMFPAKFLQSRAIRTEQDLYACYPNGVECYYRLPDEDNNLIGEGQWNERIAHLRELCGKEFVDVQKEHYRFQCSPYLYAVLSLIPKDKMKW